MTDEATDIDHSAAGHSCAHCDADEDHHSLDEKGIVDDFLSTMRASGILRIVAAVAAAIPSLLWSPLGFLAGLAAWIVATAGGIAAVSATRAKYGETNSVIVGTVVSAALLPLGAWAVSMWLGGSPITALAAAAGWFAAIALVESLRDRSLSTLLIADSRDGEAARQGVMFGAPVSPWVALAWSAATAVLFGLWTWVIGLLALAVLPLIPLQVVIALRSRRSAG